LDKEGEFQFKPMDEPPFIDTDIAKMNLLTTRDYFSFFLEEWNINTDIKVTLRTSHVIQSSFKLQADSQYVTIQFIELGGDHLDSLMLMESDPNARYQLMLDEK
jgi:hypothetical protein